ncbi:MAG: carboxymuconolactone decarboxylase family protein [Candidatus Eisenbacteria bacterium]
MSKPPTFYQQFVEDYPEVAAAYERLGDTTRRAGPLTERETELIKLALAAGARLEGAVHSHARRALDAGASEEDLRHVGVLAITTMGFPFAMTVRALIEDVLDEEEEYEDDGTLDDDEDDEDDDAELDDEGTAVEEMEDEEAGDETPR